MPTSTDLKCFPPEICSLICQDPIFKRRDLNSICFISHTFRREAQRLLSSRFPCLRGAARIKAWCLSLKRRPHLAPDVEDLILLLPQQAAFHVDDIARLIQALRMCVNLKELAVLPQSRRRGLQDHSTSAYMLDNLPFKLTKFVNDYFFQNDQLAGFLNSQKTLQTLQLHSGGTFSQGDVFVRLPYLKTLACAVPFFDEFWSPAGIRPRQLERLRLDFEKSKADVYERAMLDSPFLFHSPHIYLKSLAIFLKREPDRRQSHFLDVMRFMAEKTPRIKHLQIHQFLSIRETSLLPFPPGCHFPHIETLVLRFPPLLDDPNLCAYVTLRTSNGRREVAKEIMRMLQRLTRLVFVDHEYDYEFRRDLKTGIITGEKLIILDEQEWALVN
ncbi:hypothetical protein BYT27DRAFT_7340022 [Phlegmacium glaucopus]|nr:hypothetical protein BYT27DRAFT_7340022 [Phlegmacium glaucopus]